MSDSVKLFGLLDPTTYPVRNELDRLNVVLGAPLQPFPVLHGHLFRWTGWRYEAESDVLAAQWLASTTESPRKHFFASTPANEGDESLSLRDFVLLSREDLLRKAWRLKYTTYQQLCLQLGIPTLEVPEPSFE